MGLGTKNLIVVDDEPDLKFLFTHYFEKQISSEQLTFTFCSTANECLMQLKLLQGQTLVISDINMPETSGLELMRDINQEFPLVKVMLTSAYEREKFEKCLEKYDAVGFVSKPIDFNALRDQVITQLDIS